MKNLFRSLAQEAELGLPVGSSVNWKAFFTSGFNTMRFRRGDAGAKAPDHLVSGDLGGGISAVIFSSNSSGVN